MNNPKVNFDVDLNMISLNVKGLNSFVKRQNILNWLRRRSPDLIFLQETYSTKKVVNVWEKEWKGDMYFSHGSNHSKGVAVLVNKNVDYEVNECICDNNGRYIIIDAVINNTAFVLVNAYAPTCNMPNEQVNFFLELCNKIQNVNQDGNKFIIVGGDMNILMNVLLDRDGGNPRYNGNVMEKVHDLLNKCDLIDIWRVRNPNLRQYTWRQNSPLIQSRLDYWFVSDSLQDFISSVSINPSIKSDHSAICMKLACNFNSVKGPSYWKFNNSLCDDVLYCEELATNTNEWVH